MKAPDRSLMIPNGPVTKDMLSEWLTEIPDDAEIGIDVGQFGQLSLLQCAKAPIPMSGYWRLALFLIRLKSGCWTNCERKWLSDCDRQIRRIRE
jgi:hypothetical protein